MNRSLALTALVTVAFLQTGCNKEKYKDPRTLPDLVQLTTVSGTRDSMESFTGVVAARVESDLGFRVSGKITQRLVDEGQSVHKGQALLRIDVTDYAHAIAAQTENVSAASASAEQAVADEARYRGLVKTGAVSASSYDLVKATADAAQARVAEAKAQLKVAEDQGDYSLLKSDADGVVTRTLAEPGQVVAAGQVVMKVAHSGPREAAVFLPETVRPRIHSQVRARIYGSSSVFGARLRQLSDSADIETRTFEARYVLEGAAANAPLGATVSIDLPADASDKGVYVPIGAITDRAGGPGVWRYAGATSTVKFQPVVIGRLSSEEAEVTRGLNSGDRIVAIGAHLLNSGQHVRVAEQTAEAK